MKKIVIFATTILLSLGCIQEAWTKGNYKLPDPPPVQSSPEIEQVKAMSRAIAKMAKQVTPGLVYIESSKVVERRRMQGFPFEDFFFGFPFPQPRGNDREIQQGAGSGFIVDLKNAYVLTNNHVVEGADNLEITTADNRKFKGKVIGGSKEADVAVVKIENFTPNNLIQLSLANSDNVEVGEWVAALGAPFQLRQTLTVGIVSAVGRSSAEIMPDQMFLAEFIQTDAAVNPGNSGGPLLSIDGRVIGINTAIYSSTGSYAGISFAVPSNLAKHVAESIINYGKFVRGFLGVALLPNQEGNGAIVARVTPNSPAAKAGIKVEDIIESVDGTPVRTPADLTRKIAFTQPGQSVTLGLLRDGKKLEVKATLVEYPKDMQQTSKAEEEKISSNNFGMRLSILDDALINRYKIRARQGAFVAEVYRGSPAERAGLRPGDVILKINRVNITAPKDVETALSRFANERRITFLIERDREEMLLIYTTR